MGRQHTSASAKASRASKALKTKKSSSSKSAAPPVVIPEDITEVVIEQPPQSASTNVGAVPSTSGRVALDREGLKAAFEEFNTLLENEWKLSKEDRNRNVRLQTWKTLISKFKKLQTQALKSVRKKTRVATNPRSGFYKPVGISTDLAEFIEVKDDALVSRLDVTKKICQYIKEHELQNPADKRIIVPDDKLGSLLTYDSEKGPLTYFALQKLLQPHFKKTAEPVAV